MTKLTKHNDKRTRLVNQMNEAAGNYEAASKRVEKARKVLAAVEEAVADKEREIRAEVEALFNEKMAEVNMGLNAAKSELGTAVKMRTEFAETYKLVREQLAKCLTELPEEEALRVAGERDKPGNHKSAAR